jgi:hypothetical protein
MGQELKKRQNVNLANELHETDYKLLISFNNIILPVVIIYADKSSVHL